ncbi:N-acetyltransferase [Mollicutes bacterium LVI A0039]|nr:N-acetyltransferase [Mollicutes bacterium LVI A0039]
MKIRKITSADIDALSQISQDTFIETFGSQNSSADTKKYLEERMGTKILLSELTNGKSTFYFIELQDQVVGYVKINTYEDYILLQRIYILRKYQERGYGQKLLSHVIAIATDEKKDYIELGVWEENIQAIRFYQKNQFQKIGEHDFVLGNDIQTDYTMRLNLAQ